jgi:4-amino-4-deoxy-L-arabinose transferase-like glycosyltransferase
VSQPTPAIVTLNAVRPLPRAAVLLFCVAYVLPGFLGRDPWKSDDLAAFGIMRGLALGDTEWSSPSILGLTPESLGWLPYWLGALAIRALPFLDPATASRLPFMALLGLTLTFSWYAIHHLARLPSAQPVAFAFGGEAPPRDYGRAMADAGLLALMACLGLAQLSHETTPEVSRLAFGALMMLAMARLARGGSPWMPMVTALLSLLALLLSGMGWPAVFLFVGWLILLAWNRQGSHPGATPGESAAARQGFALVVAGVLGLLLLVQAWQHGWLTHPTSPDRHKEWDSFGRLLLWFTWPAWPLVLWTLWRWRRQLASPHIALPLWAVLVGLASSAWSDRSDRVLLVALPAFAALAAFALPTLRRSATALIDWFTLIFFSFCALVVWVVWVAMQTGVPSKPAANVAKLAPGFTPEFSGWLFLPALLATLAWLGLVAWRVGRHRQAIWKSLVLPASGATLCWLLLMTLMLPVLDYGRSYGPISRRVASLVPVGDCVAADGLTQAQIAGLQHHGQLRVRVLGDPDTARCGGLLVSPERETTLGDRVDLTHWAFRGQVRRLNDQRKESILVYIRVAD